MKSALENPNGRKWVYAVEEDVLDQADFSCGGDLRLEKLDVRMRELNENKTNYRTQQLRLKIEEAVDQDFRPAERENARRFAYAALGLPFMVRDVPDMPSADVIRGQELL